MLHFTVQDFSLGQLDEPFPLEVACKPISYKFWLICILIGKMIIWLLRMNLLSLLHYSLIHFFKFNSWRHFCSRPYAPVFFINALFWGQKSQNLLSSVVACICKCMVSISFIQSWYTGCCSHTNWKAIQIAPSDNSFSANQIQTFNLVEHFASVHYFSKSILDSS